MATEKTTAIVIRIVEFSETSCVVTLFTKDFGKITALAKGARRPKGPFESAIDLLAVCRIVFIHKSSDALDLLTEAKLEHRFRAAVRDLSRLYAGYYVAELLGELTDTADPHPDLFTEAIEAIRGLDGEAEVTATVLRFELAALRILGHFPSLESCAGCGRDVKSDRRVAFGQLAGGVLCPACRAGQRQVVSVTTDAIKHLQELSQLQRPAPMATPVPLRGEIRGLMNQYLANLMGRRPRMHNYLVY